MSTIADKLIAAAQNEQRIYKKGYDKGVADAGGTVVTKPEVEGNYNITANGSYTYTPPADKVFSKVNVEVAVSGGTEDLNDVLTAQEEKLAELSAILDTKADGYDNGFEDGRQAEYDAFWDACQENGARTDYYFGFAGRIWQNDFRPKYSIRPINAGYVFGYWDAANTLFIDLVDLCKKQNIEVDFSQATNVTNAFGSNTIFTHIGVVDVRKAPNINGLFGYNYYVHTIDKLILKPDGSTAFNSSTFISCTRLENIIVEGVIGQSGFDMQWSTLLSKTSITSIINALSTTTSGLSITLSKTAVNSAFATTTGGTDGSTSAEWAALIATRSNWTISLV